MKKRTITLFFALMLIFMNFIVTPTWAEPGDININETNFPDEKVRTIVNEKIDKDNNDVLTPEERNNYTSDLFKDQFRIVFPAGTKGKTVDLTGIEYFPNIKKIYCANAKITKIDLSKNTKLESINLIGTELSEVSGLSLNNKTELKILNLADNPIKSIDVSNNIKLSTLRLDNGEFSSLNLKSNKDLKSLSVNGCGNLTELDLANNENLEFLYAKEGMFN